MAAGLKCLEWLASRVWWLAGANCSSGLSGDAGSLGPPLPLHCLTVPPSQCSFQCLLGHHTLDSVGSESMKQKPLGFVKLEPHYLHQVTSTIPEQVTELARFAIEGINWRHNGGRHGLLGFIFGQDPGQMPLAQPGTVRPTQCFCQDSFSFME